MAQTAQQTTDNPGKIIQLLGRSEIVRAAIAETAAAQTLARRTLIGQVRVLEREHEKAVPKLEAAVADAMTALKQVQAALQAAEKRANDAIGAKSTAGYRYSATRDGLERQLRLTAHPALEGWCRDMRGSLDSTRRRFSYVETREITNPVTRLPLELDDQTDIPKILGKMAAALPLVEDVKTNEK